MPSGAELHERRITDVPAADRKALEVPTCFVCGSQRARPLFCVGGLAARVVVCSGCGLGRLHPSPGPEEVRAFYPDAYYGGPGTKFQPLIESLVRLVGARHIAFLSRGLPSGARVLDVGCGRGVVLGRLADRGFEVHGVEISAEAARGADPRAEIRIAPSLGQANYSASSFHQIIIWHVLEHLPDPRSTLLEAHRILRPGGRLIVAVPNFSSLQARLAGAAWFHLDLPRHLYHFPLPALRRLVEDAGFEIRSEHHFSLRQNPFGWIQSALNRFSGLPRNGLYTLLHRRGASERTFTAGTRFLLWLGLVLLAPPALLASVITPLLHDGATVHLVAERRAED